MPGSDVSSPDTLPFGLPAMTGWLGQHGNYRKVRSEALEDAAIQPNRSQAQPIEQIHGSRIDVNGGRWLAG